MKYKNYVGWAKNRNSPKLIHVLTDSEVKELEEIHQAIRDNPHKDDLYLRLIVFQTALRGHTYTSEELDSLRERLKPNMALAYKRLREGLL